MNRPALDKKLFTPKYLISWIGIGLWYLACNLIPHPVQIFLGRQLGDLLCEIGGNRVDVARTNIARCFPELDLRSKEDLLRKTMQETSIAIFESGDAWFWPDFRFNGKFSLIGREHLEKAKSDNKGVLFLGVHFTTIEIGAAIINLEFPISGFYRPHKNAVYEFIQAAGRIRRNKRSTVIPNGDLRGLIKTLKQGGVINYAPDQDYGRRRSVFAPFFGISAATVKAPANLAKAGDAEIIPWVTRRNPLDNHYIVEVLPPITKQLGKSEDEDAQFVNSFIEAEVRKNPEQYLWVHRRFKTRPEGEESFYT